MRVILCESPDDSARRVAAEILSALARKPDLVLGLATGSTPIGVYSRLVEAHREEGASFALVRTFNLDEYVGLAPEHPQSYHAFMQRHLFSGIDVAASNIAFPPTEGPELLAKYRAYEERIRDTGGIDVQVLGIGSNGHIGFNEPTSSLASRTRLVTLTERTYQDNSRFYGAGETQPRMASTMGIGTILDARKITLQAFGAKKADAVRAILEGPVSSFWPGSALQLHPDVTLYLDAKSSAKLTMLEYYEQAEGNLRKLEQVGTL